MDRRLNLWVTGVAEAIEFFERHGWISHIDTFTMELHESGNAM